MKRAYAASSLRTQPDGAVGRGGAVCRLRGMWSQGTADTVNARSAGWWTASTSRGRHGGNGDPVATLETTKVYATDRRRRRRRLCRVGRRAEGIVERYGAVVYIEPTNRYTVSATTEKAYNSSETKYVHIGERVYLSCTKDGTHTGTAVVTSIGGSASSGGDSDDGGGSSGSSSITSYTFGDHGRRVLHGRDRRHLPQPGL